MTKEFSQLFTYRWSFKLQVHKVPLVAQWIQVENQFLGQFEMFKLTRGSSIIYDIIELVNYI